MLSIHCARLPAHHQSLTDNMHTHNQSHNKYAHTHSNRHSNILFVNKSRSVGQPFTTTHHKNAPRFVQLCVWRSFRALLRCCPNGRPNLTVLQLGDRSGSNPTVASGHRCWRARYGREHSRAQQPHQLVSVCVCALGAPKMRCTRAFPKSKTGGRLNRICDRLRSHKWKWIAHTTHSGFNGNGKSEWTAFYTPRLE